MIAQDLSLIQGTIPSILVSAAPQPANPAGQVVICGDALEIMTAMPAAALTWW